MGSDSEAIALIPLWIVIASAIAGFFSVAITQFFAGRSKKADRAAAAKAAVAERENDALVRKAEAEIRAQEKQDEYARQDEVAQRVAAAQQEAAAAAQLQIHKLNELQKVTDVTHALVNSDMTAALEGQATALDGQLALMLKIPKPDEGEKAKITHTRTLLVEVRTLLEDRAAANARSNAMTTDA